MASTTYSQGEQRPPVQTPESPEGQQPGVPDVIGSADPSDVDPTCWERALSDCERAERNWRVRGREIVQMYRGDIPISRPKARQVPAALHLLRPQQNSVNFQHPLRQHRSDAAGGLRQAARSRRQVAASSRSRRRRRCRRQPAARHRSLRATLAPASGRGSAGCTGRAVGPRQARLRRWFRPAARCPRRRHLPAAPRPGRSPAVPPPGPAMPPPPGPTPMPPPATARGASPWLPADCRRE